MSSFMTQALPRKLSWKMTFIQSSCGRRVGSLTGAVVTSRPPQKPLSALLLVWKMGRANPEPLLRTRLVRHSTKPASCSSPRTAEGGGVGSRRGGNPDRQGGQRHHPRTTRRFDPKALHLAERGQAVAPG